MASFKTKRGIIITSGKWPCCYWLAWLHHTDQRVLSLGICLWRGLIRVDLFSVSTATFPDTPPPFFIPSLHSKAIRLPRTVSCYCSWWLIQQRRLAGTAGNRLTQTIDIYDWSHLYCIHFNGGKRRTYLWWSLCTLYLHACQVRVTVGDSGLCCACVTTFEC